MKRFTLNKIVVFSAWLIFLQTIFVVIIGANSDKLGIIGYFWIHSVEAYIITAPLCLISGLLYMFGKKEGNNGAAIVSLLFGLIITTFIIFLLANIWFGEWSAVGVTLQK